MKLMRSSSWIAWALICTQSIVLVLGHGRVVVCHDEGGSSHIEIVDEDSCSTQATEGCNQSVTSQGEAQQITTLCSDTSCVDEPLGITATLSNTRMTSDEEHQGAMPPPSLAVVTWLHLQDPMERQLSREDFDDRHAIDGFHQLNRSTVLVL